jgi:hypothetical protein
MVKRKAQERADGRVKAVTSYAAARDKSGEEEFMESFESQHDKILLDGAARDRRGSSVVGFTDVLIASARAGQ